MCPVRHKSPLLPLELGRIVVAALWLLGSASHHIDPLGPRLVGRTAAPAPAPLGSASLRRLPLGPLLAAPAALFVFLPVRTGCDHTLWRLGPGLALLRQCCQPGMRLGPGLQSFDGSLVIPPVPVLRLGCPSPYRHIPTGLESLGQVPLALSVPEWLVAAVEVPAPLGGTGPVLRRSAGLPGSSEPDIEPPGHSGLRLIRSSSWPALSQLERLLFAGW